MKIIIRAVRDRQNFIDYLSERLPDAVWCFDQTRNAMDTFLRALEMAGDEPCVHMEEDILLCDGFLEKLHAAIAERPNSVIQFFSMRKADLTEGSRWDNNFCMNQCFYLPRGYSTNIRKYYAEWPDRTKHPTGYDLMMNDWLRSRKEKYWLSVPSLVDHRVCQSMINSRRSSKRQSKTFKQ